MDERAQQLRRARTPFVHATVVRAAPPTSAHPGDEAILLSDGTIEGFVGGHCAQNSVRKAAMGALQTNESVLLRVLPDGDVHFPGGAGRVRRRQPVPVRRCAGDLPGAARCPRRWSGSSARRRSPTALVELCAAMGYDARSGDVDDLAGTTAVVIASHGGPEAETIRAALDAGVGYIGLVASRVRGASILSGLELTEAERSRVHTPVGLPIGAKTPAEIAVSIVAEVIKSIRVDGLKATEDERE